MAALFILWFFTRAPWLQVKSIRIDGNPTETTKAEIDKLTGQNILWLSVTRPETVIKENQPSLKEIQILRGIPDTLIVKLIERQPALIWQVGERWYTVDPDGFIFHEQQLTKKEDGTLEYPSTDLPIVVDTKNVPTKIGDSFIRPQFITFIRQVRDRLPEQYNIRVERGEVGETTFSVTLVTDAGWNILFDTTRSLDAQLKTLGRVLESKRPEVKEYIDVRVRGWAYYK